MTTLLHPNYINPAVIHEIGENYLREHDKSKKNPISRFFCGLKHTDEATALRLKEFCGTKDDKYGQWIFLTECYGKLNSTDNEISRAIKHLFANAYKERTGPYKLIYEKNKINDFVTEGGSCSPKEMAHIFRMVVDHFYIAELRERVKKITPDFDTRYNFFPRRAIITLNPVGLTNAMLQHIGNEFINNPRAVKANSTKFFDKPYFSNETAASKLSHYAAQNDSFEKWMALADIYGSLKKSKGSLSDSILNLFLLAFGKSVYTRKLRLLHTIGFDRVPATKVAEGLKGIVVDWYAEHYRRELRISQGSVHSRVLTSQSAEPEANRIRI